MVLVLNVLFGQSDSTQVRDSSAAQADTAAYAGVITPAYSSSIKSPIYYSANDSIVTDVLERRATLYGKASIKTNGIEIQADQIDIFWEDHLMAAKGKVDSTGKYVGRPILTQDGEKIVMDSVRMNSETKKAKIYGMESKQGEGYITGDEAKRTDDAIYLREGHYTTCNLKHPHFYINARKLKVIPNDKAVCGPFNLVIEDVHTPLGFVMGFFPMINKRKSGLIFPLIGEDISRGFFMQEGGYYWAVNDYLGIRTVGDLYANGSYRINSAADYIHRYRFNGKVSIDYNRLKQGFDNSTPPKQFRFNWTHSSKQRKNSSFRANVYITSSKFFETVNTNPIVRNNNVTNSSITYFKQFGPSPFNMTVTMRGDQNVNGRSSNSDVPQAIYNASLPEFSFNMNRIAPFKRKTKLG
ncbi:MAG: hypothetical protein MUF42_16500 [Cytophagaceae bacterium]|nr:hypothetical protein [Cytophagaceae bacterium]